MMDYMTFGDDSNMNTWDGLAKNFVLVAKNDNLNKYIDRVLDAKMQAQRKMRKQLENRILSMRQEKLAAIFTKDGAIKLRNNVKLFRDGDRILQALQEQPPMSKKPAFGLGALSDLLSGRQSIKHSMQTALKKVKNQSMQRRNKSQVSFDQTSTQLITGHGLLAAFDGNEEVMRLRLKILKEYAEEKEITKKVPLLEMEPTDEVSQIKHFALTYYRNIFSEFELNTLNRETPLDFESLNVEYGGNSQNQAQHHLTRLKDLSMAKRRGTCTKQQMQETEDCPLNKEVQHLGNQLTKL